MDLYLQAPSTPSRCCIILRRRKRCFHLFLRRAQQVDFICTTQAARRSKTTRKKWKGDGWFPLCGLAAHVAGSARRSFSITGHWKSIFEHMALRISPQKTDQCISFLLVYTVSTLINFSSSLKYLCSVYMSGRQAHFAATHSGELSMQ